MKEATANATERVRISCPGCGRNDYVKWPVGADTYAWKCFNCGKFRSFSGRAVRIERVLPRGRAIGGASPAVALCAAIARRSRAFTRCGSPSCGGLRCSR